MHACCRIEETNPKHLLGFITNIRNAIEHMHFTACEFTVLACKPFLGKYTILTGIIVLFSDFIFFRRAVWPKPVLDKHGRYTLNIQWDHFTNSREDFSHFFHDKGHCSVGQLWSKSDNSESLMNGTTFIWFLSFWLAHQKLWFFSLGIRSILLDVI